MDLMYCGPKPDEKGDIGATVAGGMRRIDRIILDPSLPSKPIGAQFLSCFAGQTDHVPFALSVELE